MNGLLLVDKPTGITSHDVVDIVRRLANTRRVGHAGTLDPFATGLLILGINSGTKELTALVGLDKAYDAEARLGATSDTYDPEGKLLETPTSAYTIPTAEDIERAMQSFRGTFIQRAPLYSAKKINGKKLYELARKGTATDDLRPSKEVTITDLRLIDYTWPVLHFHVECSSGTYIRSIADDLGTALGCGAYLTNLRRTRIGSYSIDHAQTIEQLRKKDADAWQNS